MAKAMYLEHYLDSSHKALESLPAEMQKNFTQMRDLDQKSQDLMKKIDKAATDYLSKVRHMSPEKRTNQLSQIESMFSKSREFGDGKVQLAMHTYEMVDKHIRKLDAELARFEADIKMDKTSNRQKDSPEGKGAAKKKGEKEKKKRKANKEEFDDEIPKKKKKKGAAQAEEEEAEIHQAMSPFQSVLAAHPSDVLDMPVDPNEPTYCLCNQVSYGEMIGCDNLDCPIEWFHFACVQLKIKPKGKWFCPRCQEERKKK